MIERPETGSALRALHKACGTPIVSRKYRKLYSLNMPIEETVAEITHRLRQGRFSNEQAISQGIVLRLLQDLGWNTCDTSIVWPEFQTGEGRNPASR